MLTSFLCSLAKIPVVGVCSWVLTRPSLETKPSDVLSTVERKVRLQQSTKLVIEALGALDSLPLLGVEFAYTELKMGHSPSWTKDLARATSLCTNGRLVKDGSWMQRSKVSNLHGKFGLISRPLDCHQPPCYLQPFLICELPSSSTTTSPVVERHRQRIKIDLRADPQRLPCPPSRFFC